MARDVSNYGTTKDGKPVELVTLTNAGGSTVKIITFGAILTELHVPDRDGKLGDVVLGFDDLASYENGHGHLGETIGRVANRIAKAKFTLNGNTYRIPANNGENALHGGPDGYGRRVWEVASDQQESAAKFRLVDPDGCMGFPGRVTARVTYELTDNNTLKIRYQATTDRPTPINLTNHTYFNLADAGKTSIADHVVQINAFRYTPTDKEQIPTGEIALVEGSLMDLRSPTRVGDNLEHIEGTPPGYDHNYVLSSRHGAEVFDPASGRRLTVVTGQPGVQFYTGNQLNGAQGGKGAIFERYHGLCLETQHFPDSVNHANFPSTIVKPGATYEYATEFRFSVSS